MFNWKLYDFDFTADFQQQFSCGCVKAAVLSGSAFRFAKIILIQFVQFVVELNGLIFGNQIYC